MQISICTTIGDKEKKMVREKPFPPFSFSSRGLRVQVALALSCYQRTPLENSGDSSAYGVCVGKSNNGSSKMDSKQSQKANLGMVR